MLLIAPCKLPSVIPLSERALEARLSAGYENRSEFARLVGVSASAIQQIEEGTTLSLRGRTLQGYVRVTNYSGEWLSSGRGPKLGAHAPDPTNMTVAASDTGTSYVRVEQLDAEGAMGEGVINDDYPDVIRSVDFTEPYIRALIGHVPPAGQLKLITGRGNSMAPLIMPGDVVVVDTGCTSFEGDGIYLVNLGNGQQIKALQDRGDSIYVVSVNTVFGPVPVTGDTIIGGKVYLRNRLERLS